jgi:hypothetical protein
VQPTFREPMLDSAPANPECVELPTPDDPMLPLRKRRDLTVRPTLRLTSYDRVNLNRVAHRPIVAVEQRRGAR